MATRRVDKQNPSRSRRPPATTPEQRENQLVSLAVDLAETQLRDGTASAQVISHYLKLGSSRERLEQERLQKENELLDAKREAMASAARVEELYTTAMNAFRAYSGQAPLQMGDEDEYED
jgi:hypothetical protein